MRKLRILVTSEKARATILIYFGYFEVDGINDIYYMPKESLDNLEQVLGNSSRAKYLHFGKRFR